MSWSVVLVGTPEGVNKELDVIGDGMPAGQSKDEFMEVKPHLQGLVKQAVGQNIKLTANGHATLADGVKTFGSIQVNLECFYGKWCA